MMNRTLRVSLLLWILAGVCSCACTNDTHESQTPAGPEDPERNTVRVATWNVHNLFDTVCDSDACGGNNYEPIVYESTYKSKISRVVSGIWTIDADVILLQEIEKESILLDIQKSLGVSTYPDIAFGETGRAASVDVGILTRGTITDIQVYRDSNPIEQADGSTKLLSRELVQAEITLPNDIEITAFTTHFVSKVTDPVGDRRLREAILVQQIVADYIEKHPNRLVIFGGDLNDTPETEQILAVEKDGLLLSVSKDKDPALMTTWHDSVTFDYLFYPTSFKSALTDAQTICDQNRYNGFSSSDHCAVKATFTF